MVVLPLTFFFVEVLNIFLCAALATTNSTASRCKFDSPLTPRDNTDTGSVLVLMGGLTLLATKSETLIVVSVLIKLMTGIIDSMTPLGP